MPTEKPTCATCRFWVDDLKGRGACRRYPPQVNGDEDVWPVTKETQWCGEHQPRETSDA